MRCCSWAASWLSSGVDTIGNFHPLHYVILSDTFAQHDTLPLTSTLNGRPSFARSLRRVGEAEYVPMFLVAQNADRSQSRPLLVRFGCVFLFRVLNFQ